MPVEEYTLITVKDGVILAVDNPCLKNLENSRICVSTVDFPPVGWKIVGAETLDNDHKAVIILKRVSTPVKQILR